MMRLAADAGGTFTDLIGFNEADGSVIAAKTLTTTPDPARGVLTALRQVDGLDAVDVGYFVYGSTTVINAITERKGVVTALVTTRGFRDVLAIGRGNRPDLYNLHARPPEPFVPRHLRYEVSERVDAQGRVRTPLDTDDLETVAMALRSAGVAAVALAFLHAYANPAHEARAAAVLRARLPDATVIASHETSRQWREYERTSTAVLSAYVQPIIATGLARLAAGLRAAGVGSPLYCMQSSGGLGSFDDAATAPLSLVESGPAGGVAGAVRIAAAIGVADILYLDVGGTTAKCSLVRDGKPVIKPDYRLEWSRREPGYPVQVPVVDIVEIGAGGGSIAWIDPQGSLRVGPSSAGADPGPACYARDGTAPTVTDAKLLIGVLNPERFAGGQFRLDAARAAEAMQPIADRLGLDVTAAAAAVIRLAEARMVDMLKLVTVQRGHDPRLLALLASGGGGPMHAAALGQAIGAREIVIPLHAGLFSAWGMLAALPRLDLRRTQFATLSAATPALVRGMSAALTQEAMMHFGTDTPAALRTSLAIDMRYEGQEHTVPVVLGETELANADALLTAFHAAHEQAYTFSLPDTGVELTTFHLTAELAAARIALPELSPGGSVAGAQRGTRRVYLEAGFRVADVFDRDRLPVDTHLAGPVLIEEPTATTLVLPGQSVSVDRYGLLHITARA